MATVIRLKRIGAKKDPVFRIVVADSRSPRDGRFIEQLGFYNPQPKEAEFRVDVERASYWLGVGATASDQVRSLFRKAGVSLPSRPTPKKKESATKASRTKTKTASAREVARRTRKREARVDKKAAGARREAHAKAVQAAAAKKAKAAEAAAAEQPAQEQQEVSS